MTTAPFAFPNARGETLAGRLETPDGPTRAVAIFAHCFTCSKESAAAVRVSRGLAARGWAVLRFDFAGLGASAGEFADTNFSSNVQDIAAAAARLRSLGMAPAALIGHSLGGAAVLAAGALVPDVRAIACIGAPSSVEHVTHNFAAALPAIEGEGEAEVTLGGKRYTIRRQLLEDLRLHDIEARVAGLKRALLVLHAPRDEVVGIEHATRIFVSAKHPKSFVSLDTADHYLVRAADAEYAAAIIAAWAERYIAPGAAA